MKLIFCPKCYDIVRIYPERERACKCGSSWGQYAPDGLDGTYGGEALPLCFLNYDFGAAVKYYLQTGKKQEFIAFFCPEDSETYRREE